MSRVSTVPETGAKNTSGQHYDTMQQRKNSIDGYADQSKWQKENPEQRIENERGNRQRPAQNKNDNP
jgi:hypothetical protein